MFIFSISYFCFIYIFTSFYFIQDVLFIDRGNAWDNVYAMWHLIFSRSISLCPHVLQPQSLFALMSSLLQHLCRSTQSTVLVAPLTPICAALLPHWHSASGPHLSFLISFSLDTGLDVLLWFVRIYVEMMIRFRSLFYQ
jgi:hypothetical protein